MTEAPTTTSSHTLYPETLKQRDYWVTWALDDEGRKRPRAPWRVGHSAPCKWSATLDDEDRPETDFETAKRWADLRAYELGREYALPDSDPDDTLDLGLLLPDEQPPPEERVLLVDWDNVRDPETGATHPLAAAFLKRGDAYAELSQSGTGAHQFPLGELPNRRKLIVEIDDEPWMGCDDLPQVEIYDCRRHVAMTGRHIDGTPEDLAPDQDLIDAILDQFADDTGRDDGTAAAYGGYEVDPDGDYPPCYHATLQAREDPPDHLANWELIGYATILGAAHGRSNADILDDLRAHPAPPYGFDPNREPNEVARLAPQVRSGDRYPPNARTLTQLGILPAPDACDCPIHDSDEGGASGARYGVETCTPPVVDAVSFDRDERRAELRGPRYDAAIDADGPVVHADPAGAGKTTNTILGAIDRGRDVAILLDKHEKAREELRKIGDVYPDEWDPYHLKGGSQKRESHCMDADHTGEPCPEHGAPRNCPAMCPVYDLGSDDPARQRYEALRAELNDVEAHLLMGNELPGHDEDGHCDWLDQFAEAAEEQAIVGVHEYQLLKTVQERKGGGPRDVIVDEAPRTLRNTRRLGVLELTRAANTCDRLAATPGMPDGFAELARFARDVIDVIADEDGVGGLEALDAPHISGETINVTVDPDDPPADVTPDEIEVERNGDREVVDPISGQYVERERHYVERELLGEQLAQLKLEYNETLVKKMKNDEWDGTPLCFDALLAAAVRAGLDADAARQAIAVPTTLDHCPWCGSELALDNGARCCSSDTCDWHEEHNYITRRDGERARADAYLDLDARGDDEEEALVYEELALASELPDRPIVLDATADREVIGALYGVAPDDVTVYGDEPLEANMRVTQVLDGQYHAGTIQQSDTARERIQRTIDTGAGLYEKPLFLVKGDLIPLFDFPDHATVRKWHALRGLNFDECDAVFAIGAPHPRIDGLEREARLLAMGCDDLEAGGEEYSTRRDAPNPPVYRKLNYGDKNGDGRAVPTKHYSGLVGALFREAREKELVQGINRARPLLADADEPVDVYLLTNVPTDLPIDEVCSFADLADPLEAMLPVPDGALDLVGAIDAAVRGDLQVDGFRAETVADRLLDRGADGGVRINKREATEFARVAGVTTRQSGTPSYRTVARWVDALEDVGLFDAAEYEQRRGVAYAADPATLTRALSVLSGNGGFKVAAVRRFRALVDRADGALDWLAWARRALSLGGDRCEWDPPPHDPA